MASPIAVSRPARPTDAVVAVAGAPCPGRASAASARRRAAPNTIRPTRSPARRSRKSASTALAAVRRSTSAAAERHVLVAHAAGQVDREHQVATRLRRRAPVRRVAAAARRPRTAAPMRAMPARRRRAHAHGLPRAGDRVQARAVGHLQCRAGAARRRQQPAHEPRQRQRQQQPWPGEAVDHGSDARITRVHPVEEARARDFAQAVDFQSGRRRGGSRHRAAALPAPAANIGCCKPRSRKRNQSSPCSLSASRIDPARRAAQQFRHRRDFRRRRVGALDRVVEQARDCASTLPAPPREPRRDAQSRAAMTAATSHQPGAGGHHDGAGGWWMSRRLEQARSCITPPAPAPAAAAMIRSAHRSTARARARRAPAAAPARPRSAPRIHCASAGVARRWPGRVRRRCCADCERQRRLRRIALERIAQQQHDHFVVHRSAPASAAAGTAAMLAGSASSTRREPGRSRRRA